MVIFCVFLGFGSIWISESVQTTVRYFSDQVAAYMLYPFLIMGHQLHHRWSGMLNLMKTHAQLEQERVQAQAECDEWKSKFIQLQREIDFVDETDELVDFRKRYYPDNALLAQIIMRQISAQKSCFSINAGTDQGVAQDMIVVYKNCLLGRVTHVYSSYAQVTLITDPHSKVSGECATTHAQGIYEGRGGSRAVLNFVSHLETIYEGDLVISSGNGAIFPRGFALGRIHAVMQEGLYHQIEIEPLIDLTTISYCYVLNKV